MTLTADLAIKTNTTGSTLLVQIESLLSRLYPPIQRERRHDDRVAIPVLFRLTPLDADRVPLESDQSIVVGKNISRRGVSFYHENAISHRRARIELVDPVASTFSAEIDITWCRFTKPGWYESGARLIRAAKIDNQPPASDSSAPVGLPDFVSQLSWDHPASGT